MINIFIEQWNCCAVKMEKADREQKKKGANERQRLPNFTG